MQQQPCEVPYRRRKGNAKIDSGKTTEIPDARCGQQAMQSWQATALERGHLENSIHLTIEITKRSNKTNKIG